MPMDDKEPSTERDKTDESLRAEREKTDQALAARQTAEQDADAVVDRARDQADAILTEARDKADRVSPELAPPASIAEARAREDHALQDKRTAADEKLRREREESERALAMLLPMERDKTDRFLLTERERSDDAISHRDDFLSIVSHDLRNLLGGIVMSAGLLSQQASESDEGKQVLVGAKRIQRYAARMNRLIGDLLDVASIDAGTLEVRPGRGDSGALIAEAVELFQSTASAKGVSLTIETVEPSVQLEFDHDRMLQVFANLLTNSIKFTAGGGKISVRCERAADSVRFSISDTGVGVPSHMLQAIFQRFWQADKYARTGVGLGLYISKCIVEAHGGTISAESKLGEWTIVRFTLPVAAAPKALEASPPDKANTAA